MFGMTIFVDPEAPEDDVTHVDQQVQGLKHWIEYALSQNPDTIFSLSLCPGWVDPLSMWVKQKIPTQRLSGISGDSS